MSENSEKEPLLEAKGKNDKLGILLERR